MDKNNKEILAFYKGFLIFSKRRKRHTTISLEVPSRNHGPDIWQLRPFWHHASFPKVLGMMPSTSKVC